MGVERLEYGRWPSVFAAKVSDHTSCKFGDMRGVADGTFKRAARLLGSVAPVSAVHSSWAEGVVASICKFEISLGTMKVLDVELDGSSLAH